MAPAQREEGAHGLRVHGCVAPVAGLAAFGVQRRMLDFGIQQHVWGGFADRGAARRQRRAGGLAQRAGLDAQALRAGGPSDAELDALFQQYTEEALAAGVFGAPSYVLPSGEIFWGQDRLELLERAVKMLR